jgi:uracil-DNA glycosylase family 4
MRNALNALTDELRRLKTAGVKTVSVSDEGIAALRRVVAARKLKTGNLRPESGDKVADETGNRRPETVSRTKPETGDLTENDIGNRAARVANEKVGETPPKPALRPIASVPVVAVSALPDAPVVVLPAGDKTQRWAALFSTVVTDPTCCSNVRPGKKVVLGVGSLDAKIMFVGEAPGADEEIQGEPFVGPAGQLLTKMIQAMGMKRSDVYIGNIMNWRPQMPTVDGREQVGNRPPTEEEMRYCLPYLRAQIDVVNPDLLVALGSTAAQGLLGFGSFKALGDIRGKWHEFSGKPLMVTYHPSYILRNQSNRSKRMIWEDLLKVMERASLPVSEKQRSFFLDK